MKVLFINSNYYDYLQDLVFSGLVKILGQKNVVEFPWNSKFHLPFKQYPKNMGYVANSLIPSLATSKRNYDVVIVGACKGDALKSYLEVAKTIPADCPVLFIDGGDRPAVGGDLERLGEADLWQEVVSARPFDYIFKREYKLSQTYEGNVIPLPFGFNMNRLPRLDHDLKYDVAFWAAESHPTRISALELLKGKYDCEENGTERGKNMYTFRRKGKEYLRELGRCKINLSFRGGGFDTLRYWEIPAVGSMLLSEKADINIPNNFINEESAVFCLPDLTDLIDKVDYYLRNEERRAQITARGHQHLITYHTDVERAKTILATIN